jgi:polar amino acid transport system permease protein
MNYTFDFSFLAEYRPMLMQGLLMTLQLSALSTLMGFVAGTGVAYLRVSNNRLFSIPAAIYVEFIRNTPLLIQAYFLIFGLASIGVDLPIMAGAVIALTINVSAYTAEIMRAGIESIHKGQIEAAHCLGLSKAQVFFRVVLAPATERVYPSLVSQYVLLMLATSILSAVGIDELFGIAARVQSITFRNFEVFIVLGVLYVALSFVVRGAFNLLGKLVFPRLRRLGTPL